MSNDQPPLGARFAPLDDEPVDWELLARYVAGESPPDEVRRVEGWLAAHPADAELLAALDATIVRAAAAAPGGDVGVVASNAADIDVEGALRHVRARRDGEAATAGRTKPDVLPLRPRRPAPTRARGYGWRVGGIAAAAAVAALAVGVVRSRIGSEAAPSARSYETAIGARDSVRLPDGSRVVLAPGSRLVVAADYGTTRREVTLEGAAWFAVRHDDARAFTVHAGPALVRDVGTTFSVRTDGVDGARGVAVAVTEGAVALRAAAPSTPADTGVVLAAGDRGVLHADGRVDAQRGGVTTEGDAWTRGRLVYRDAPLDEVRADLRRWYGVNLLVADSTLAARRLTATFDGESVERVLDVVALAVGGEVDRAGNTVVLRRRSSGGGRR